MSWLRPEKETEYNKIPREPLSSANIDGFLSFFKDYDGSPLFDEKEKESLKQILIPNDKPMTLSTGYPLTDVTAIDVRTIYITETHWQQGNVQHMGAAYRLGRASTSILVTGTTLGEKNLNMAQPSLVLRMLTALMIAGQAYFTKNQLLDQTVVETNYNQDEPTAFHYKIALRSLTMSYEAKRMRVITHV
ncbi:MAG: hypothetical protein GY866_26930 [Proteobacteria bacterium]|nr:hypothetical protein [Pseudomonadota bacterium]